ncbi:MAG: hypothetical protein AAF204_00320, partial [Pseudomonadota bacterium]
LVAGPAWSFEASDDGFGQVQPSLQKQALINSEPSSPTVADSCLPLLSAHTSPQSAMDRNQRSAGKAAALGLVLGVRFALSPPKKVRSRADKPRLDFWQVSDSATDNRSALAVTAYRECQKEKALKAISEFRWAR